jgi:hypothetical protein
MSYSPRPGCGLAKAIAHLRKMPAGTKMRTCDLSEAIGVSSNDLSNVLRAGVTRGLILRTKGTAQGTSGKKKVITAHYWSLPDKRGKCKDTFQRLAFTQLGAQSAWRPEG